MLKVIYRLKIKIKSKVKIIDALKIKLSSKFC